jgi:lipid-binding SYLF domain-containing protein
MFRIHRLHDMLLKTGAGSRCITSYGELNMIRYKFLAMMALASCVLAACTTAPSSDSDKQVLHDQATIAFNQFEQNDSSLAQFLSSAYGYVIFPSVGKGAIGIGGAYGRGEVWEQGKRIGWADLTQATIGAQLGGQSYSELLVFQNKFTMETFKSGNFAFSGNASAVAAASGAAATATYQNGVAVFTRVSGGLMFEASIGGQKFSYAPLQED